MTFMSFLGRWWSSLDQSSNNSSSRNNNNNDPVLNGPGQASAGQNSNFPLNGQGQTPALQANPTLPTLMDKDTMEKRPLKYIGYPLFTQYLASSREVVVLRRFDQLHARVLLKMQDDIVQKEEEIDAIDRRYSLIGPDYHINGSFRNDARSKGPGIENDLAKRSRLLDELKTEIRLYDETILNYRKLRSDPEPSQKNINNVRNYLYNRGHSRDPGRENRGPILQPECEYIYKDGDLLELVPETKAPLRQLTERWSFFMLGPWFRRRPKGTQYYQDFSSDDKEVSYQSDARIEGFITFLSLLCGLALLIGPLQLLNRIDSEKTKLDVICGLVAAFLVTMGLVMPAKPWETLAATAAYSAVLMVFMQINHEGSPVPTG